MSNKSGITLIEIMVVVFIMSIIFGMGSAFLTHSGNKVALKMASNQTATYIALARSISMQDGCKASVRICRNDSRLDIFSNKLFAYWPLEDSKNLSGAFGLNLKSKNVYQDDDGKIGKCLRFVKNSELQYSPIQSQEGFLLSFWIYPERNPENSNQNICKMAGGDLLVLKPDYTIFLESDSNRIESDIRLNVYFWSEIQINYFPNYVSIIINGNEFKKNIKKKLPYTSELKFGDNFFGKIDEIKLSVHRFIDGTNLPQDIIFKTAPEEIFLDNGFLDIKVHTSLPKIVLERSIDKEISNLVVLATGQVEIK